MSTVSDRRPSKCFVAVRNQANAAIDRRIGFTVQGLESFYQRRHPLQPNDLIALYVTSPLSGFIATVEIVSERYCDESSIWEGPPGKTYANRYRTRPRFVAPEGKAVAARALAQRLEIARYLPDPEQWGVLFRNAFREIPEPDFDLIETQLRALRSA